MIDPSKFFNIVEPEQIKFDFPGKLGRLAFTLGKIKIRGWSTGQFIITNKRIIFVIAVSALTKRPPLMMIVPLDEIKEVSNEKDKIIFKCDTFPDEFSHRDTISLAIGFYKQDIFNYKVKNRLELTEAVYEFLKKDL